jgi:hypothetical protein
VGWRSCLLTESGWPQTLCQERLWSMWGFYE